MQKARIRKLTLRNAEGWNKEAYMEEAEGWTN
jgi:hypothetical protein